MNRGRPSRGIDGAISTSTASDSRDFRSGAGTYLRSLLLSRELIFLLVAIGIFLRLAQYAANRSLWHDESLLALNLLEKSTSGLAGTLDFNQGAPIGFLLAERLVAGLFGFSEYSLRLIPLLSGVAALPLFVVLARRVLTPLAVPFAVLLFAVDDAVIYYSSELKPYSLDVSAAIGLLLAGIALVDRSPSRREAVALGVGGVVLITLSYAAVIVLAGDAIVLTIREVRRSKQLFRSAFALTLAIWAVSAVSVVAFAATRLSGLRETLRTGSGSTFGAEPGLSLQRVNIFATRVAAGIGLPQEGVYHEIAKLGLLGAVIGVVSLLIRARSAALLLLLPFALTFFAAAIGQYPLLYRTVIFLVPAAILFLAEGLVQISLRLPRHWAPTAGVLLAVAMLVWPLREAGTHLVRPRKHEEIKPILEYIRDHWRRDDTLYLHYGAQYAFLYYEECKCLRLRGRDGRLLWPVLRTRGARAENAPALVSTSNSLLVGPYGLGWRRYTEDLRKLRARRRVWFVYTHVNSTGEKDFIEHKLVPRLDRVGRLMLKIDYPGANAYLYDFRASRSG